MGGAHITPDREPDGEPVVNIGLAMCALHHRAFDAGMLTVSPEYQVVILEDRLAHRRDRANRVLLEDNGRHTASVDPATS